MRSYTLTEDVEIMEKLGVGPYQLFLLTVSAAANLLTQNYKNFLTTICRHPTRIVYTVRFRLAGNIR